MAPTTWGGRATLPQSFELWMPSRLHEGSALLHGHIAKLPRWRTLHSRIVRRQIALCTSIGGLLCKKNMHLSWRMMLLRSSSVQAASLLAVNGFTRPSTNPMGRLGTRKDSLSRDTGRRRRQDDRYPQLLYAIKLRR